MSDIRIRKTLDSETLHLPELKDLIGKTVEIIVRDETTTPPPPRGSARANHKLWAAIVVALVLLLSTGGYLAYLAMRSRTTAEALPLPVVTVETVYPGASAQVVADTVATPIEQQVNGVEGMVSMRSQCSSDGRYTLSVSFARGVDLDMAQVLLQNRVNLAQPALPEAVQRRGISSKKRSPQALLFVILSSPDGRYDTLYLNNYAGVQIKDELARVPGVAEVVLVGPQDEGWRIQLDPDRLAALNLTAADVARALKKQKLEVQAGSVERMQLALNALDVDHLQDVIVKADAEGRLVRLRDVASIERGTNAWRSEARLNGKHVVVMAVYPLPQANAREVNTTLQDRLTLLRARLPQGLDLQVAFDFTANQSATTPEYLRVDLVLPDTASAERMLDVLETCAAVVRRIPGVQDELALCGPPFALTQNQACILVRLVPAKERQTSREQLMQALRAALEKAVPQAVVRLCDVSSSPRFPLGGYAIDLAVFGPELQDVGKLAAKLAERLRQSGKLTDVGISPEAGLVPQLQLDIDRTAAAKLGVSMSDIFSTLQVFLGSFYVNDFNRFGRTWQVHVQLKGDTRTQMEDIQKVKVRNAQGKLVPLNNLATIRVVDAPVIIERLDLWPMVGITANPAAGLSLAEARSFCEAQAEEVRKELGLPAEYRWTWLGRK